MYHHRSGTQKQANKGHKGGAASKRELDNANHGRIEKPAAKQGVKHADMCVYQPALLRLRRLRVVLLHMRRRLRAPPPQRTTPLFSLCLHLALSPSLRLAATSCRARTG